MSSGTAAEDGGEPVRGSVVLDGVRDPAGERRVAAQRAASLEALAAATEPGPATNIRASVLLGDRLRQSASLCRAVMTPTRGN